MMESNHIVLLLLVILTSVNGKFGVVGPSDPIRAIAGEDAVLECQLVPDIFASSMVVQWFKSGLDSPVHMYINGEDHIAAQQKDYRGRTELFKDELTKGNISLRIQNITRSDRGEYICSVDDQTDSGRFTVGLEVVGFGCEPWIQMKGYDISGIQLVCKSTGWFPEPKIEWVSEDGHDLIQAETTSHWGSTGLVDVHSNIVIPRQSSNRLTCRVQNKHLKIEQVVTIGISGDFLPVVPVWLVSLLLAMRVLTIAISAMIYWTVKHYPHMKELELWKFIIEHEWKRICECEAPVTLDPNTAHPDLLLSKDLSTVWNIGEWQQLPDNPERFDLCIAVLGSEGFTSGKHSWEVEVGNKTEWTVGVVKESINRKGEIYTSPHFGYWKVSLRDGNKYWAREASWKFLELSVKPRKIRVCLDYEGGKVSFFNSENKSHIYTFTETFTEKIYPYFSPCTADGGKNTEPLKICPQRVTIQEDEGFIPSSK